MVIVRPKSAAFKSFCFLLAFFWQPVRLVPALFSGRWSTGRETSASVCQGTEGMSNLKHVNTPYRVGIGATKHKKRLDSIFSSTKTK